MNKSILFSPRGKPCIFVENVCCAFFDLIQDTQSQNAVMCKDTFSKCSYAQNYIDFSILYYILSYFIIYYYLLFCICAHNSIPRGIMCKTTFSRDD